MTSKRAEVLLMAFVRPMAAVWLAVLLAWPLAAGVASNDTATGETPERNLAKNLVIRVDPADLRMLDEARRLSRLGNHETAVGLLRALLEESDPDDLVPASSGEKQRFVHVADRANALLAELPDETMEVYRKQCASLAAGLLRQAIVAGDLQRVRRVATSYAHTRAGAEALRWLGEMHLDRGRFAQAGRCFTEALAADTSSESGAVLLALQAVAWHHAGQSDLAAGALARLKERHPDARAALGGKSRAVVDFVESAQEQPPVKPASSRRSAADWPGPGGVANGIAAMPFVDACLGACWNHPGGWRNDGTLLNAQLLEDAHVGLSRGFRLRLDGGRLVHKPLRTGREGGPRPVPSYLHPVVSGRMLIYRTAEGFVGLHRQSGELIGRAEVPLSVGRRSATHRHSLQSLRLRDTGRYGLSVGGGLVYGLTFHRVHFGNPQPAGGVNHSRNQFYRHRSEIVALEIESGLKLADGWRATSGEDAPEPLREMKYLSAPCYARGRLYVVGIRQGDYHLVCLDAETGGLRWIRSVAGIPVLREDSAFLKPLSADLYQAGSPPAVLDGTVLLITNAGAVVAVDAETGRLVWAHQYESTELAVMRRREEARLGDGRELDLRPGFAANPVLVSARHVICLPIDSKNVIVLDRLTGELVREIPRRGQNHLASADGRQLVLSGPGFHVIDLKGEEPFEAPLADTFGRPAVSRTHAMVCGPGKLYIVDLASGKVSTREQAAADGSTGLLGNLVCVDGWLYAANGAGVSAYRGKASKTDSNR